VLLRIFHLARQLSLVIKHRSPLSVQEHHNTLIGACQSLFFVKELRGLELQAFSVVLHLQSLTLIRVAVFRVRPLGGERFAAALADVGELGSAESWRA
jgi:hypothetical protein